MRGYVGPGLAGLRFRFRKRIGSATGLRNLAQGTRAKADLVRFRHVKDQGQTWSAVRGATAQPTTKASTLAIGLAGYV